MSAKWDIDVLPQAEWLPRSAGGRLEIGEWQAREGEARTSYDIWADDVINLSLREDGGTPRPAGGYAGAPAQTAGVGASAHSDEAADLDDLPF